ncbi:hypothetical protein H131_22486 [Lysinibacillus sphaericus OT4b.31]|uniref:Uncharacterized protein n=1 Tax=Lysinibacillus sphaericus OT4b.31 TaxID=1285586 RepID=R7Z8G3_LYSSH|nr:hypothetical protein H131_22486 [Lysinibacillus sphaericus OT4b.31]
MEYRIQPNNAYIINRCKYQFFWRCLSHESKGNTRRKKRTLKASELKNNPTGSLNDGMNRGIGGNLSGMGWKDGVALISILLISYIIYKLFFS